MAVEAEADELVGTDVAVAEEGAPTAGASPFDDGESLTGNGPPLICCCSARVMLRVFLAFFFVVPVAGRQMLIVFIYLG